MRFWDRLWLTLLLTADRLFGTRWLERELSRRQSALAAYQNRAEGIQHAIEHLEDHLEALHLQLCILYLRQRHMIDPANWLALESGGDDEPGLNLLIQHLVRPRLAAVETQTLAPGRHAYLFRPHWQAIVTTLENVAVTLEPDTVAWLRRQIAGSSEPVFDSQQTPHLAADE